MVPRLLPVGLLPALLLDVADPVGRSNRAKELHVSCIATLFAFVIGLRAWIREMPEITVVA